MSCIATEEFAKAPYTLPALPWADDALEPYISANTLSFHYGKHHKTYVDKLNPLVEGTDLAGLSIPELVAKVAGDASKKGVFNNAAQVWNHSFFWLSMKKGGGGEPTGAVKAAIEGSFGTVADFKKKFADSAATLFGSGWVFLIEKDGKLEITQESNAGTPLASGGKALCTLDVWEHAYYLDFQNRRPDYTTAFLDHLIDWDFIGHNLDSH